jgi:transcriptional regulator with XRE-family HTH domain
MPGIAPAKLLLVARGEKQSDVARAIDYGRVTLNQALNGQIRPSRRLKRRLAEYLGVDESELFNDDGPVAA